MIDQTFNSLESAVKIPYRSFLKSSELGFPDFTLEVGLVRIHYPGSGEGYMGTILVRVDVEPKS